jgi:hypothetical protein
VSRGILKKVGTVIAVGGTLANKRINAAEVSEIA